MKFQDVLYKKHSLYMKLFMIKIFKYFCIVISLASSYENTFWSKKIQQFDEDRFCYESSNYILY